jgi:hypothetical protein
VIDVFERLANNSELFALRSGLAMFLQHYVRAILKRACRNIKRSNRVSLDRGRECGFSVLLFAAAAAAAADLNADLDAGAPQVRTFTLGLGDGGAAAGSLSDEQKEALLRKRCKVAKQALLRGAPATL